MNKKNDVLDGKISTVTVFKNNLLTKNKYILSLLMFDVNVKM